MHAPEDKIATTLLPTQVSGPCLIDQRWRARFPYFVEDDCMLRAYMWLVDGIEQGFRVTKSTAPRFLHCPQFFPSISWIRQVLCISRCPSCIKWTAAAEQGNLKDKKVEYNFQERQSNLPIPMLSCGKLCEG